MRSDAPTWALLAIVGVACVLALPLIAPPLVVAKLRPLTPRPSARAEALRQLVWALVIAAIIRVVLSDLNALPSPPALPHDTATEAHQHAPDAAQCAHDCAVIYRRFLRFESGYDCVCERRADER